MRTRANTAADSYMQLIAAFPLRRIRTAGEHARARKLVLSLSTRTADRGTAEYLDVLIDLVADYEKRMALMVDTSKVSAAEIVRHRADEKGLSISSLARSIGVPQSNLTDMLNGKRDWSKTAIRELSVRFSIRADRFLS